MSWSPRPPPSPPDFPGERERDRDLGAGERDRDFLGERLRRLASVRTWIAQGTGDEVCPETFARQLVAGLEAAGVPHTAYFFDAGHSAKSDGSASSRCLDCALIAP